jgi:hypothetical protein
MQNKQYIPPSILRGIKFIMSVSFKVKDSFCIIITAMEKENIKIFNRKSLKSTVIAHIRMLMNHNRKIQRKIRARKNQQSPN